MGYSCWVYIFSFSILKLIIIIEAKRSHFLISNLTTEFIKDSSKKFFCNTERNNSCVSSIKFHFNSGYAEISSETSLDDIAITTDYPLKIYGYVIYHDDDSIDQTIDMAPILLRTPMNIKATFRSTDYTVQIKVGLSVTCQDGYMTPGCKYIDKCRMLPSDICRNNGICTQTDDKRTCKCSDGFRGTFCEELVDPCKANLCGKNSNCRPNSNERLKYECDCNAGYTGTFCEELIDPCKANLCGKHSKCRPNYNERLKYECDCDPGYTGTFCEELINPCKANLCGKHSKCRSNSNESLKYECDCNAGYTGVLCQELEDPCQGNLCSVNSSCRPIRNDALGYQCICNDGYTGTLCEADVDNCAGDNSRCSQFINATCISTKLAHVCYCDGGCKERYVVTTVSDSISLPFKWPFSELITFLFVILQALFILALLICIAIIKLSAKKSKVNLNHKLMSSAVNKSDEDCIEFGSKYHRSTLTSEFLDNRQSINPNFDTTELQTFGNNHFSVGESGVSTFVKR